MDGLEGAVQVSPDTLRIVENGQGYLITKREGRFAQFCALVELMRGARCRIVSAYWPPAADEETTDEDVEEDDDDDEEEGWGFELQTIGVDEDAEPDPDPEASRERDGAVLFLDRDALRRRASPSESRTYSVGVELGPTVGADPLYVRVDEERVYASFRAFECVGGFDRTIVGLTRPFARDGRAPPSDPKDWKGPGDVYRWCQANAPAVVELEETTRAFLEKAETYLTSLSLSSSGAVSSNSNSNNNNEFTVPEDLLKMLRGIDERKKLLLERRAQPPEKNE